MRSHWRSRAATERHETRSLSAGTINKREQFHKGNKDMAVLCSVGPAARSCIDRQHLRVSVCGRIGSAVVLICCQSADRATAGVTHTIRHTKCDTQQASSYRTVNTVGHITGTLQKSQSAGAVRADGRRCSAERSVCSRQCCLKC